jgi:hypothetical protein
MVYNPTYRSLEETYFQGEFVYNYGGFVPKYPVVSSTLPVTPQPTPTPSPSQTMTPTITPTNTCTPTYTPTHTITPTRAYWEYELTSGATSNDACSSTTLFNFYSPSFNSYGPTVGEFLYLDPAMTIPAPDGYYADVFEYYFTPARWFGLTFGTGQITTRNDC